MLITIKPDPELPYNWDEWKTWFNVICCDKHFFFYGIIQNTFFFRFEAGDIS